MTNYEEIKSMNLDEMLLLLTSGTETPCHLCKYSGAAIENCRYKCAEGVVAWLESEVEE